jgi:hypothetical protein
MKVPAMPMKSISVMTTVSPIVWAERVGSTKPPKFLPSIIALIIPDARAKKNAKYATATIQTTFEGVASIRLLQPLKSRL